MVSREQKRTASAAALHERLQLLRSITKSHAESETSIILDASRYIKELKQKVEQLNQDVTAGTTAQDQNSWPAKFRVVVTQEKGFLVSVCSDENCPGLLVSILEAFEELGLNVLEARVSCTDNFQLEALGEEDHKPNGEIDAQAVERAISQAIKNWGESKE